MLIVNKDTCHGVIVNYVSAIARTVCSAKAADFTCLSHMGQAANALPATVLPDGVTDAGSLRLRFFVRAGFSMQNKTQRQCRMFVGRYSAV